MSSNHCDKVDYEGGDATKRQTGLRVAVWPHGQSPVCAELTLWPTGCTPALSVTQIAAAAVVCGLWHYVSELPFYLSQKERHTDSLTTTVQSVLTTVTNQRPQTHKALTVISLTLSNLNVNVSPSKWQPTSVNAKPLQLRCHHMRTETRV